MADDISTGEIGRRLDDLKETVAGMAEKLDNRPDHGDLENLRSYFLLEQQSQNKAIKALEDANTWIVRTVASAIIIGLVGLVFALLGAR